MANLNIIRNCLIKTLVVLWVNKWIGKRYSACSKDVEMWCFFVKDATRLLKLACWIIVILILILWQEFMVDETLVDNPVARDICIFQQQYTETETHTT